MFRRKRRDEPIPDEDFPVEEEDLAQDEPTPAGPVLPSAGPWDVDEAPDDDVTRLDLGSLRVPVTEDVEVRVEVGPDGEAVTATLVYAVGALQVSAFAAPRREGLWTEVRDEIAGSIGEAGGTSEEGSGPFGAELHAQVPTETPGQNLQPARFLGVDGPRWFLRGVISGPAAVDPAAAVRLEEAFRAVVVARGAEAMAPRDALPLRLPKEAVEAAGGETDGLNPFERGPEITEIQ